MPPKELKEIRVRIAPSPTGFFHFGTARTALFNYLFAKKNNGKFIVRIEDTDKERSKPEYEKDILDGLRWLGLNSDEDPVNGGKFGPYRQSERTDIYAKYLEKLLKENKAYYCFCRAEDLEEERKAMMESGIAPKYSGKCRNISHKESEDKVKQGAPSVIRFKMPEEKIHFNDLIKGKIEMDLSLFGDQVIAKNIREPLYNFAVVVDDHEMKISHVIRGEDHLSNTPKQIPLQKALGFEHVIYAHLPLILNPDRSKMSKRFLDVSIKDYKDKGYLPSAMVNFMALIGWHPEAKSGTSEKEIFNIKELISEFNLERVQKGGGIFSEEKLDWINSQFIKSMEDSHLLEELKLRGEISAENKFLDKDSILKIIKISKERMKKLSDFKDLAQFFFMLPSYDKNLLIWKKSNLAGAVVSLNKCLEVMESIKIDNFKKEIIEKELNVFADKMGKGDIYWPLRVALSGKEFSPPPQEIMDIIGKEESIKRVKFAIEHIEK